MQFILCIFKLSEATKWYHKEFFNGLILLCPLKNCIFLFMFSSIIDYFLLLWIWFPELTPSWIQTCFLLYSKPYTQYFVQNVLTSISICKLKIISVYLQILNCVIKDNIAWDHYIEQLQERLCYLSSHPGAEALRWALLCSFM